MPRLPLTLALLLGGCGDAASPPAGDAPTLVDGSGPSDGPAAADDGPPQGELAMASGDGGAAEWTRPFALLSLNLHCLKLDGTAYRDNESRFAAIAQAAAQEGVAVIAAQEVCDDGKTVAVARLGAALERATGVPWGYRWVKAHIAWEGTPDQATEGLAVLVRGVRSMDGFDYRYFAQKGLERVFVAGRLPPALGGLTVVSVHLSYEHADVREAQARETASVALGATWPGPGLLIAGDFNDRPGSPTYLALRSFGYTDLSAALDGGRIDHLFTHRASGLAASGATAIFDGTRYPKVSDHPGYLVRLAPAPAPAVVATTLVAKADVAPGTALFVRGAAAPFNWNRGWIARPVTPSVWTLVTTEVAAAELEFKFLANDRTWQSGDNSRGRRGEVTTVWPQF